MKPLQEQSRQGAQLRCLRLSMSPPGYLEEIIQGIRDLSIIVAFVATLTLAVSWILL